MCQEMTVQATITQDKKQSIMYALSMLSNLNSNYPAKTEQNLYDQANKVKTVLNNPDFQDFAGKWSVVWGPGLFSKEEKPSSSSKAKWVAHNAMFMLKKEGREEYFIGVAGTNGISAFDWFKEDFEVSTMVAWPPKYLNAGAAINSCKIAEGTNTGLSVLWKMKGSHEKETTLFEYVVRLLTNLGEAKCSISIGGHSLGGCLAPVLGVALIDALTHADLANGTALASRVTIIVNPTAGPTPGNQDFANHMGDSVDYQGIINENDVVPLAWDFNGLRELKGAFNNVSFGGGKLTPNQGIVHNFLRWAQSLPGAKSYTRPPENPKKKFELKAWRQKVYTFIDPKHPETTEKLIKQFAGIFYHWKIIGKVEKLKGKYEKAPRRQLAAFFLQMGLQHVKAYSNTAEVEKGSGLILPKPVQELMSVQYYKPTEETKKWIIAQLVDELAELTTRAANWVKENPEPEPVEQTTAQADNVVTESRETERELSNAEMESVLEELGKSITDLPIFKEPFV